MNHTIPKHIVLFSVQSEQVNLGTTRSLVKPLGRPVTGIHFSKCTLDDIWLHYTPHTVGKGKGGKKSWYPVQMSNKKTGGTLFVGPGKILVCDQINHFHNVGKRGPQETDLRYTPVE